MIINLNLLFKLLFQPINQTNEQSLNNQYSSTCKEHYTTPPLCNICIYVCHIYMSNVMCMYMYIISEKFHYGIRTRNSSIHTTGHPHIGQTSPLSQPEPTTFIFLFESRCHVIICIAISKITKLLPYLYVVF